jgi:hypothetical protein
MIRDADELAPRFTPGGPLAGGDEWVEPQSEIRFTGDLQRLEVRPGDVFVLSVDQAIDTHTADWLRTYVSKQIGCTADKVLVLSDGLKLEVVSATPEVKDIAAREAAAAVARGIARANQA